MGQVLRYIVISPPDREFPVIEIWQGENMIADIDCEIGEMTISIYPPLKQELWIIPFDTFHQILAESLKILSPYVSNGAS